MEVSSGMPRKGVVRVGTVPQGKHSAQRLPNSSLQSDIDFTILPWMKPILPQQAVKFNK